MSDGCDIHYRLWGPETGSDVLVVLHGGMSHSAWQRPLADAVRKQSPLSVFAPDRRGCGLNGGRGDLASANRSIGFEMCLVNAVCPSLVDTSSEAQAGDATIVSAHPVHSVTHPMPAV